MSGILLHQDRRSDNVDKPVLSLWELSIETSSEALILENLTVGLNSPEQALILENLRIGTRTD